MIRTFINHLNLSWPKRVLWKMPSITRISTNLKILRLNRVEENTL